MPERNGRGIFAAALLPRFPNLPVEEEGRLSDPRLRENFIERVFAYQRLRRFFAGRWTVGGLVQFHTAHKMSLLSHSTTRYRELGSWSPRRRDRAARGASQRLRVAVHGDDGADRDAAPAHQRADAHGRASQEAARCGVEAGVDGVHRRVPPRAGAAGRAADAAAPPRRERTRSPTCSGRRISSRIRGS